MQKVFLLVLMITLLASFSIAKQPERSLLSRRRLNDAFLLVVEAGKCDGKGQKPSWLPNTAACNIARNALPDPYRNSKYDEYDVYSNSKPYGCVYATSPSSIRGTYWFKKYTGSCKNDRHCICMNDCPVGTFGIFSQENCQNCAEGRYSNTPGLVQVPNSETICTTCPKGFYSDAGSDSCTTCPKGFYGDEFASNDCKACRQGKYNTQSGKTSEAECSTCPIGKVNTQTGSTSSTACVACAPGEPAADRTSCIICQAGTFYDSTYIIPSIQNDDQDKGSIQKSYFLETDKLQYISAESNCNVRSLDLSNFNCHLASIHSEEENNLVYELLADQIAAGEDKFWIGLNDLNKEDTFKFTDETGFSSESYNNWKDGEPNDYNGGEDCVTINERIDSSALNWNDFSCNENLMSVCKCVIETPCTLCSVGKYQDTEATSSCKSCEAGQYNDENGKASCKTDCNAGSYITSDKKLCKSCPEGFYQDQENAPSCKNNCNAGSYITSDKKLCKSCPEGFYQDQENAPNCKNNCNAGSYIKEDETDCLACPKGQYKSSEQPLYYCEDCDDGKYNIQVGQQQSSNCLFCVAGKAYNSKTEPCDNCVEGKYQDQNEASLPCKFCGFGKSFNSKTEPCNPCDRGTYQNQDNQPGIGCSDCAIGFYAENSGSESCHPCPSGKYQNIEKQTECKTCSDGSVPNSAQTSCDKCIVGTFSEEGVCKDCQRGRYANAEGSNRCKRCSQGKYGDQFKQTACIVCPIGTYNDETSEQDCKICGDGSYQNQTGRSSCYNCQVGRYYLSQLDDSLSWQQQALASSTSKKHCKLCPMSYYSSFPRSSVCVICADRNQIQLNTLHCENTTNSNIKNHTGCAECQGCRMGKYINPNSNVGGTADDETAVGCLSCQSGFFSIEMNVVSCKSCPSGYYNNKTEAKDCTTCPSGYFDSLKSVTNTSCSACGKGKYQSLDGSSSCVDCYAGSYSLRTALVDESLCITCSPGYYSNTKGATTKETCIGCPEGTYSLTVAATDVLSCSNCNPGFYNPNTAKSICTKCSPGQVQSSEKSTSCIDCEIGQIQSFAGEIQCSQCNPGSFQAKKGQITCSKCRNGLYQSQSGKESCEKCIISTYSQESGQTSCINCPAGYDTSSAGQKNCFSCSLGSYNSNEGSICKNCPKGYSQNAAGSIECFVCPKGYYQPAVKGVNCLMCNPGLWSDDVGVITCKDCEPGYFQPLDGQIECTLCPIGYMTNGRASICSTCSSGRYGKLSENKLECIECPAGYSQMNEISTYCYQCNVGRYSVSGRSSCSTCPSGWSAPLGLGNNSCTECVAGRISVASSSCDDCPSGYSSVIASDRCSKCRKGQFSNLPGSSECLTCQSLENVTNINRLYQDQSNATDCKECPIGQIVVSDSCRLQQKTIVGINKSPEELSIKILKRKDGKKGSTIHFSWKWLHDSNVQVDRFVLLYQIPKGGDLSCHTSSTSQQQAYDPGKIQNVTTVDSLTTEIHLDLEIFGWCHPISKASVYAIIQGQPSFSSVFATKWTNAKRCGTNKYLNADDTDPFLWKCQDCPEGASCAGAAVWSDVKALFGHYRILMEANQTATSESSAISTTKSHRDVIFVPCKFAPACLGAINLNQIGLYLNSNNTDPANEDNIEGCNVKDGYQRYCNSENIENQTCRVCGKCREGYSRDLGGASYRCSECPTNSTETIVLLVLGFVGLIVMMIVLVLNAMSDASKDLASDALQKIIVNYLQAAAIALSFPLKWPQSLVTFFNMQGAISTVGEFLINPDCQLSWMNSSDLFYAKLLAYAILPVALVLLSWCWWRFVAVCLRQVPWEVKEDDQFTPTTTSFNLSNFNETKNETKNDGPTLSSATASLTDTTLNHNRTENQLKALEVEIALRDLEKKERSLIIKTNKYRLKSYPNTIVGHQLCTWMMEKKYTTTLAESVIIGKLMVEYGTLDHTHREHTFENSGKFYIFDIDRDEFDDMTPDPKDQFILSLVILMYLLYPTLCKQVFRLFTCVEIGGLNKWYLSTDLQVECWMGYHLTMVLLLGIPQLIVYIIGLPVAGFVVMYHSTQLKHVNNLKIKYRYGVLFSGYRPGMIYWEVVVALRKVLVSGLVVLVSEIGVSMQIHIGMMVLIISLVAHLLAQPFVENWYILERFETGSLVVCWLTLWSGIVYIQNDTAAPTGAVANNNAAISSDKSNIFSENESSAQLRIDLTTTFIVCTNVFFLFTALIVVLHQKLADEPTCCSGFFQLSCLGKCITKCFQRCIPLVEHSEIILKRRELQKSQRIQNKLDRKNTRIQNKLDRQSSPGSPGSPGSRGSLGSPGTRSQTDQEIEMTSTTTNVRNPSIVIKSHSFFSSDGKEWEKHVDDASGSEYYHCQEFGLTQWKCPE